MNEYDADTDKAIQEFNKNKRATKRLRLNHDIDKFTILRTIVRNYLNLINIYKIKVEFPWEVDAHITNLPDWEFECLEMMLLFGIVGYRCNYLPFYKVELLTHVNELVNFGFEEDRFYWLSSYVEEVMLKLPCLYADGRRPSMQVQGANTSMYWMYNGLLSHLYNEYQLHDALQNDTRIASNTSAAGMFTRTVDLKQMDMANTMQAKRFKTLNNPTITTDIAEGQTDDIRNMVTMSNALMDAVVENHEDDNGDERRKPTRLPPAVIDSVVYPPKILMGAFISYENNMRQYVMELVVNSVDECNVFMGRMLQAIYDTFLEPELFYSTYKALYLNMIEEIEQVMQNKREPFTPNEKIRKKPKSVPYFRRQIVQWMEQHRKVTAERLAFFQTLTPQTYENFLSELGSRYEGRTYAEMEQDSNMEVIVAWLDAELSFCDKEIKKHAAIRKQREKEAKERQKELEAEEKEEEESGKKKKKKKEEPDPNDIVYTWSIIKPMIDKQDVKVNKSNEFLNQ